MAMVSVNVNTITSMSNTNSSARLFLKSFKDCRLFVSFLSFFFFADVSRHVFSKSFKDCRFFVSFFLFHFLQTYRDTSEVDEIHESMETDDAMEDESSEPMDEESDKTRENESNEPMEDGDVTRAILQPTQVI